MIYPPPPPRSYSALSPPFSPLFRRDVSSCRPECGRSSFASAPSNAVLSLPHISLQVHHSHSIYLPFYLSIYPLQLFLPPFFFFFFIKTNPFFGTPSGRKRNRPRVLRQPKRNPENPLLKFLFFFLFCEGRSHGSSLQNLGKQGSRRQQTSADPPPKVINQLTFIFPTVLQPLTRLNIHPTPWVRRCAALLLPHFLCV